LKIAGLAGIVALVVLALSGCLEPDVSGHYQGWIIENELAKDGSILIEGNKSPLILVISQEGSRLSGQVIFGQSSGYQFSNGFVKGDRIEIVTIYNAPLGIAGDTYIFQGRVDQNKISGNIERRVYAFSGQSFIQGKFEVTKSSL